MKALVHRRGGVVEVAGASGFDAHGGTLRVFMRGEPAAVLTFSPGDWISARLEAEERREPGRPAEECPDWQDATPLRPPSV